MKLMKSFSPNWLSSPAGSAGGLLIVVCLLVPGCRTVSMSHSERFAAESANLGHSDPSYGSSGRMISANTSSNATDGNCSGQAGHVTGTPRELCKVSLPRYVIEPPDILLIEAVNSLRMPETPLRPGETLIVRVANTIPVDPQEPEVAKQFKQINGAFPIQTDGIVDFGPEYGYVAVAGLTVPQARQRIEQHLKQTLISPQVYMNVAAEQARQHIAGEHLVRPDGTVSLGIYGTVSVTGLTLEEAKARLEQHLAAHIYRPEINVDVLAYNSKIYYVITDGAGAGEQVFRFPCTGNETILDAVSHINGLPTVASKKHIWIARPAPPELGRDQVLQVDWDAIVRRGQTTTNYQVLPGDRIYVRADHMVIFDTLVGKVVSPFERIFGWTLLGNSTVRALQSGSSVSGGGVF